MGEQALRLADVLAGNAEMREHLDAIFNAEVVHIATIGGKPTIVGKDHPRAREFRCVSEQF